MRTLPLLHPTSVSSLYLWLKAFHVLFVTLWIGSAVSVFAVVTAAASTTDRARLAGLCAATEFIGKRVIAPGGGLTLLSGIALAVVGKVGMPFWIIWGLGAGLVVIAVGGAVLGRGLARLAAMTADTNVAAGAIESLRVRLQTVGTLAILTLVTVVLAMVLKPTL